MTNASKPVEITTDHMGMPTRVVPDETPRTLATTSRAEWTEIAGATHGYRRSYGADLPRQPLPRRSWLRLSRPIRHRPACGHTKAEMATRGSLYGISVGRSAWDAKARRWAQDGRSERSPVADVSGPLHLDARRESVAGRG